MRRSLPLALALLAAPALSLAQTAPDATATPHPAAPTATAPPTATALPTAPTAPAASTEPATVTTSVAPTAPSASSAPEDGSGGLRVESTPAVPDGTGEGGTAAGRPTPTPAPADLADRIASAIVLHGYLRTRAELFHNFAIGWDDPNFINVAGGTYGAGRWPWVRNPDNGLASVCSTDPAVGTTMRVPGTCSNNTQSSGNMRLRLNPEIHITDSIAIHAQFDILDNLVLGSTPQGYYTGGAAYSPWAPLTAFNTTQVAPNQYNSYAPSVNVSRAWAEVSNPSLGQVRFGRMPSHWGLGLVANAGNGIDSDYSTNADRIMYAARVARLNLFLAAAYDFAGTGPTSASPLTEPGWGQAYSISQLTDVHQFVLTVGHRLDPVEAQHRIAHGDIIWNGGVYAVYRYQLLDGAAANHTMGADPRTVPDVTSYANQLIRRDAQAFIGDVWFQLLGSNFRFELEAAMIYGATNLDTQGGSAGTKRYDIQQFGGAMEFEYRLLNNRLQIEFRSGFATGDSDLEGLNYQNGLIATNRTAATSLTLFRFHPDYRVDLIFWRQIMQQVSGAYYFRPGVQYVFVDRPGGDHFFGRASVIWSRATEFVETRGNHPDLGVEIDAELTYMSNYRRTDYGQRPAPGFFASLQYGVFFPMGGLGPTDFERTTQAAIYSSFSFSTAQTVRGIAGVLF